MHFWLCVTLYPIPVGFFSIFFKCNSMILLWLQCKSHKLLVIVEERKAKSNIYNIAFEVWLEPYC